MAKKAIGFCETDRSEPFPLIPSDLTTPEGWKDIIRQHRSNIEWAEHEIDTAQSPEDNKTATGYLASQNAKLSYACNQRG